jgi:hypothetical protein
MERRERLDSLESHDDLATHREIRDLAGLDFDIVVADRQADLVAEWDAGLGRFVT